MVRTIRKRSGLRDEGDSLSAGNGLRNNAAVTDLFGNSSGNAEWYFNNSSLRSKGYNDFKTKWGSRQNVDNWQLSSLARSQVPKPGERAPGVMTDIDAKILAANSAPVTFKSLMDNLPLTPEKLKKLNDSIEHATYTLGRAYQDGIADYKSAITTDEGLLEKFPSTAFRAETLFNLYNCYKKVGDEENAERILALMKKNYPGSHATALATNPDSTTQADGAQKVMATRQYEKIYNSFIEGRFAEALADKKIADSVYGDKYWTPQLMYIEAVYYIKQREDGQAISVLLRIPIKYPKTPMAAKATSLIDVLKRRREIEDYLTKLEVKRASDEDTITSTVLMPGKVNAPSAPRLVRDDSRLLIKEDTSTLARSNLHVPEAVQTTKPGAPVIAGRDQMKMDAANMNKVTMDAAQLAKLQRQMDSINQAMARAAQDSIQTALLKHKADSIQAAVAQLRADSAAVAAKLKNTNTTFTYTPDKPHSVVIVLTKVDPVYVTETRNAFNRWNMENFYAQSLTIENSALNDSLKLVVINSFGTSAAAIDYLRKAKAAAPREVVPWLPAGKYSFMIISAPNLQLLLSNKDMEGYKKFVTTAYQDKF